MSTLEIFKLSQDNVIVSLKEHKTHVLVTNSEEKKITRKMHKLNNMTAIFIKKLLVKFKRKLLIYHVYNRFYMNKMYALGGGLSFPLQEVK